MNRMLAITRKELQAYFGSPMAAIFIGVFLLAALFSFFWLETFFARNIADVRPLFRWMPLLMIFLTAALTMRQWSEEQKMGTLEILLTLPVRMSHLVAGKFLAVLALVCFALVLTLGLPVTVAILGDIDWGPVVGGYLGTMLMASTYIAIGLFVSSRTDNQIVALMGSVLISGFFYLFGSTGVTNFMGNDAVELFRSLGTGSRFASIERGVLDLRDMAYYVSLTTFFLMLNSVSLEKKRWSRGEGTSRYRRGAVLAAVLISLNLVAFNLWLQKVNRARIDLTEDRHYSVSAPTLDLLGNLQEPLHLRGYFSEKTHPLLAPLVPRIKDLMEEYEAASGGRVKVGFIDPKFDEEAEVEANQQYGIRPVPFQVAGRYEAGVVNSYFHVLVLYGDQYVTLSFDDLIEIQRRIDGQVEVRLRNLEYDLTKSIRKAVYGFQSLSDVFEDLEGELKLTAIITPETLPEQLAHLVEAINGAGAEIAGNSHGRLDFAVVNPDDPASGLSREDIKRIYGVDPLSTLFSDETFYLYLYLESGSAGEPEPIYLAADMERAEVQSELEAAIKRAGSGFLKTIGVWTPPAEPGQFGMMPPQSGRYSIVQNVLRENFNLQTVDLADGYVPGETDVLLLLAPQKLTDLDRFAIDQYLMRGGSVVALAGNYVLDLQPGNQVLSLKEIEDGIAPLLEHYGISVEGGLIMDLQNEPFPIPVQRDIGGIVIQEIRQLEYPFFVDVRSEGLSSDSPVTASLNAVTMNWSSPVSADAAGAAGRKVTELLRSSADSWLHDGISVQPDFVQFPQNGFAGGTEFSPKTLGVTVQGSFESYFADREDPRRRVTDTGDESKENAAERGEKTHGPLAPIIPKSGSSARLAVLGSSEFVGDTVIGIGQSLGQERFMNGLQFLQNLVDWAVEDEGLSSIRSRGTHVRLLEPLSRREQGFWEWLNYGVALLALLIVSMYGARRQRREKPLVA